MSIDGGFSFVSVFSNRGLIAKPWLAFLDLMQTLLIFSCKAEPSRSFNKLLKLTGVAASEVDRVIVLGLVSALDASSGIESNFMSKRRLRAPVAFFDALM